MSTSSNATVSSTNSRYRRLAPKKLVLNFLVSESDERNVPLWVQMLDVEAALLLEDDDRLSQ
jgi:hypothetical protein